MTPAVCFVGHLSLAGCGWSRPPMTFCALGSLGGVRKGRSLNGTKNGNNNGGEQDHGTFPPKKKSWPPEIFWGGVTRWKPFCFEKENPWKERGLVGFPESKKMSPSWSKKNAKGFTSEQGQDIVEGYGWNKKSVKTSPKRMMGMCHPEKSES